MHDSHQVIVFLQNPGGGAQGHLARREIVDVQFRPQSCACLPTRQVTGDQPALMHGTGL